MNRRRGAAAGRAVHRLSPLFVVAVAWLAVADIPIGIRIGPLSVSGLATLTAGAASVLLSPALLLHGRGRSAPRHWRYAIASGSRRGVVPLPLVLFCGVALIGLVRDPSQNGFQQVAVYCAFAGAIAFGALYSTRDTANRYLHVLGIVMGVVGLLSIPVFVLGITQLWGARSFALTGMIAIAMLVPARTGSQLLRVAPYAIAVGIAASLSRTALVIAVLLLAFSILRSRRGLQGLRIVLALGGLAVAAAVVFLAIPSLRERFTQGDNGVDVGGVALNTSGRSQIWALVVKDSLEAPWFGHGAGAASDAVTARYPFIAQPHNDYLRLWHDFGLVGLGLFVLAVLLMLGGALRRAHLAKADQKAIHWAAFLSLLAVAAAALTDNPVIYPFVMIPLGIVLGLSIGRRDLDGGRPAPVAPRRAATPRASRSEHLPVA